MRQLNCCLFLIIYEKYNFIYITTSFSYFVLSKEKFDFVAAYSLTYPINKVKNDEQFLLFMNSKKI